MEFKNLTQQIRVFLYLLRSGIIALKTRRLVHFWDIFRRCKRKITFDTVNFSTTKLCNKCIRKLQKDNIDMDSTIFVPKQLLAKHGWPTVSLCSISGYDARKSLLCAFPECETCKKRNFCCFFAQKVTYFNILRHFEAQTRLTIEPASNVSYGSVVRISLVKSPYYSLKADTTKTLTNYFTKPRLLSKSDLFFAPYQDSSQFLCFKVLEIEESKKDKNGTFLVQKDKTALFQLSNVHSFAPQSCFNYFQAPTISQKVFDPYIEKIASIIEVFGKYSSPPTIAPSFLLSGQSGCGKKFVCERVSHQLSMHLYVIDCFQLWSESAATSEAKITNTFNNAKEFAPCILLMKNIDVLGKDVNTGDYDSRVLSAFNRNLDTLLDNWSEVSQVTLVCTTNSSNMATISTQIISRFLYSIEIESLTENDRIRLIEDLLLQNEKIDAKNLAQNTAGLALSDLCNLVKSARLISATENATLNEKHIASALQLEHQQFADEIGAPKVPAVSWDDVGGIWEAKEAINDTIQMSLDYPELFNSTIQRSGVLLYGPPGCGKTLLAKAIASERRLTFLAVKGPELLNMYVGQSEQNVREVFSRARQSSPCVLFFDELDSLAPNRGRSGDSGGVMDRVVSQLLSELDGIEENKGLFVIGATNRPDLIDPSLLRPGRLDKCVYVGIGDSEQSRLSVLKAVTRKMPLSADIDLRVLLNRCRPGMSGADFGWLATSACNAALARIIKEIDGGNISEDDAEIIIEWRDLDQALSDIKSNDSMIRSLV